MSVAQLQTAIDSNDSAIAEYAARLAEDALAPKASYSLDGESCSRNEWRKSLTDAIADLTQNNVELQKVINLRQPFIYRQRHRL